MGNMGMVRGSHLLGRPPGKFDTPPDGMCELTGEAGDAVLFDRRLWHAASTNCSDRGARVFLTYGYSYRWLRPKSEMNWATTLLPGSDPVRRQLLGDAPSGSERLLRTPQPEDVPLRTWMEAGTTRTRQTGVAERTVEQRLQRQFGQALGVPRENLARRAPVQAPSSRGPRRSR